MLHNRSSNLNLLNIYASLYEDKPLFGSFYGAYLPKDYDAVLPILANFPDPPSIAVLRARQVQYVIVDSRKIPSWTAFEKKMAHSPLRLAQTFDTLFVYILNP